MAVEGKKIGGVIAGVLATAGLVYLLTRPKGIALSEGGNEVIYTGKEQTAVEAFASIMGYLLVAYHHIQEPEDWELVREDTIMIPGEEYYVDVSADCTWTF